MGPICNGFQAWVIDRSLNQNPDKPKLKQVKGR